MSLRKFKVTCLQCGNENVVATGGYDGDVHFDCRNCGQEATSEQGVDECYLILDGE